MRVETARPKRSVHDVANATEESQVPVRKARRRNSGNMQTDTISGMELPSGRKIERGWTSSKDEGQPRPRGSRRSRQSFSNPSSLTAEEPKCLFKTKQPASDPQRKRKRVRENETTTVSEFEHTTSIETAENADSARRASHRFVDGEGWFNEAGELVEPQSSKVLVADVASDVPSVTSPNLGRLPSGDNSDLAATGLNPDSDRDLEVLVEGSSSARSRKAKPPKKSHKSKGLEPAPSVDGELSTAEVERLSISRSSGSPAPQAAAASQPTSAPSSQIHPLEAFFKRPQAAASHSRTPKKPHLEVSTSFSFFGTDQDIPSTEDTHAILPQTPFTQQDFRHRQQRSAAPTPDTALPGKTFEDSLRGDDSAEDSGNGISSGDSAAADTNATEIAIPSTEDSDRRGNEKSEGAKWFYEHRGETNRSWKRRRREATKERKLRDRRAKK